eukprot:TRINITY_DN22809_c0_g3_i1.p1 TRINITY_DN22809_c0_g3~~TRINITY_DN22809_c0_g3_i1.p1  ORF type:complete len:277 (-),score=40.18 TRINITY_DN22809_c0_g3_i1:58-888(-)
MREIKATGYMSNRGRYIVASYLVHFLGIDWRVGADWFEHLLLDHDVCTNYGEWASMAGVAAAPSKGQPLGLKGRGPTPGASSGANGSGGNPWAKGASATGDAVFDPWEQGKQYDKSETFVRRWVPELREVPQGAAHWPHDLTSKPQSLAAAYPKPLAVEPLIWSDDYADAVQSRSSQPSRRASTGRSQGSQQPPQEQKKQQTLDRWTKRTARDEGETGGNSKRTFRSVQPGGYEGPVRLVSAACAEAVRHAESARSGGHGGHNAGAGRRRWAPKAQ